MRNIIFIFLSLISLSARSQQLQSLQLTKNDADTIIQLAAASNFSGNILLYQGDKKLASYSTGFCNEQTKSVNNAGVRYNIGSMGKTLTAILIMQLVEKKIIDLDKTANAYLPDNFQLQYNSTVTIRQLLNMTSGFGDFFDSPDYNDSIAQTAGLLKLVLAMKPVNETPGLKFGYSNSGFIVSGGILEHYYHKSYQQLLQEKILMPAGINYPNNSINAIGYSQQDSSWIIGKDNNTTHWSAAGGIYLSIDEFNVIVKALNDGKYLKKATIDLMWAKESHPETDPPFVNYGLGWMVEAPGGIELRGHNGGVRGFQSCFRYLPQDDIYIYVFSNHENGAEELFMKELFFLFGKKGVHFN
jgi:D-alanyl-D-alanine carboxypeptidase